MLRKSDLDLRLALNQLRTENPESEWTLNSLTTYYTEMISAQIVPNWLHEAVSALPAETITAHDLQSLQ
jgi:hypothetical protein